MKKKTFVFLKKCGFTLIEVVIALSLITIVSATALSITSSANRSVDGGVDDLYRAKTLAQNARSAFVFSDNAKDFQKLLGVDSEYDDIGNGETLLEYTEIKDSFSYYTLGDVVLAYEDCELYDKTTQKTYEYKANTITYYLSDGVSTKATPFCVITVSGSGELDAMAAKLEGMQYTNTGTEDTETHKAFMKSLIRMRYNNITFAQENSKEYHEQYAKWIYYLAKKVNGVWYIDKWVQVGSGETVTTVTNSVEIQCDSFELDTSFQNGEIEEFGTPANGEIDESAIKVGMESSYNYEMTQYSVKNFAINKITPKKWDAATGIVTAFGTKFSYLCQNVFKDESEQYYENGSMYKNVYSSEEMRTHTEQYDYDYDDDDVVVPEDSSDHIMTVYQANNVNLSKFHVNYNDNAITYYDNTKTETLELFKIAYGSTAALETARDELIDGYMATQIGDSETEYCATYPIYGFYIYFNNNSFSSNILQYKIIDKNKNLYELATYSTDDAFAFEQQMQKCEKANVSFYAYYTNVTCNKNGNKTYNIENGNVETTSDGYIRASGTKYYYYYNKDKTAFQKNGGTCGSNATALRQLVQSFENSLTDADEGATSTMKCYISQKEAGSVVVKNNRISIYDSKGTCVLSNAEMKDDTVLSNFTPTTTSNNTIGESYELKRYLGSIQFEDDKMYFKDKMGQNIHVVEGVNSAERESASTSMTTDYACFWTKENDTEFTYSRVVDGKAVNTAFHAFINGNNFSLLNDDNEIIFSVTFSGDASSRMTAYTSGLQLSDESTPLKKRYTKTIGESGYSLVITVNFIQNVYTAVILKDNESVCGYTEDDNGAQIAKPYITYTKG